MATKQEMHDGRKTAWERAVVVRGNDFALDYRRIKQAIRDLADGAESRTISIYRPKREWYISLFFPKEAIYGIVKVEHSRNNEFTFSFIN